MQWWVDTLGKLGPAIIAVIVLGMTLRQNSWQNLLSFRAAQVEDQKVRLALLDRRVMALEKLRSAMWEFWVAEGLRPAASKQAYEALYIAELVFDESDRLAIASFTHGLTKWQSLSQRLMSLGMRPERDEVASRKAMEQLHAFETPFHASFEPLLEQLQAAARIKSVDAPPRPPTMRMVLRRWLR